MKNIKSFNGIPFVSCKSTWNARNGDVLTVCTLVIAPTPMSTIYDTRFRSSAHNVTQPNLSTTRTETFTNKPASVSVYVTTNYKTLSPTQYTADQEKYHQPLISQQSSAEL